MKASKHAMMIRTIILSTCLVLGLSTTMVRETYAAQSTTFPIGSDLTSLGWEMLTFDDISPTMFSGTKNGILEVRSDSGSSVLYRAAGDDPVQASSLSWSWQVVDGLPATDLQSADGDDRVLAVHVVFAEDDIMSRLKGILHPFARGRVITYVWGDDEKAEFPHPHLPNQGFMMIRKTADYPMGKWFTETIDLEADYMRAFGKKLPPVAYVAISGDADDLNAMCFGMIKNIRLH